MNIIASIVIGTIVWLILKWIAGAAGMPGFIWAICVAGSYVSLEGLSEWLNSQDSE